MNYKLICGSCNNSLYDQGIIIKSEMGQLLMCSICRSLYCVDIGINSEIGTVLVFTILNLSEDQEYNIIRDSIDHIPFSEYLPKKEEKKLNIHEVISSSKTPSDLIRLLSYEL